MVATKTRIVTDLSGNLQMIIHPDDDTQLDSVPEFSPANAIVADVSRVAYDAMSGPKEFLALLYPILNEKSLVVGIAYQAKIDAMDMAAVVAADVAAAQDTVAEPKRLKLFQPQ